ncbi:hypothetical protein HII13_003092 [Brettanomyces bruxellensis]|nr:hypothetical protein HII13_003092 [Brettanomyces bruxellensis]
MFNANTNDEDVNMSLNRLCRAYEMPAIFDPAKAVTTSYTDVNKYRQLMFPNNMYSDDIFEDRPQSSKQQPPAIVGQSIANNSGIPLNLISKMPSYQWNFRHEDDHKSYHYIHSHRHHKGKNILNGLGTESISSLAGTSANSNALNSRMIRLPIQSNSASGNITSEWSAMNGLPLYNKGILETEIRCLNMDKVEKKIPVTNVAYFSDTFNKTIDDTEYVHSQVITNKFMNNKRIMRNYQWMLYYNRMTGGKRLEENPALRYGQNSIVNVQTVEDFRLQREKRKQKFLKFRKIKAEIASRKRFREQNRQKRLAARRIKPKKEHDGSNDAASNFGEFFSTAGLMEEDAVKNKDGLANSKHEKEEQEILRPLSAEEQQQEKEEKEEEEKDKALESQIPEFEDEISLDEDDVSSTTGDDKNKQVMPTEELKSEVRGISLPVADDSRELIIEKDFSSDDPELLAIQRKLYGIPAANHLEQQVSEFSEILRSKRVLIKRVPNPNAIGYCNIRRRKPVFL